VEGQRSLTRGSQINRRIVFVRDDLRENAAHLQAGRILAGRNVLAFDRLVDAFQSANLIGHPARKFFKHVFQMLKIAADEKLRLARCDVERYVHRVNGVGDLLHLGLET
jgi:hypothetical protein